MGGPGPRAGGWPSPPGSLPETAPRSTSCLLKHLLAVSELLTFLAERPGLGRDEGRKGESVPASSSLFSDMKVGTSLFSRKELTVQ